MTHLAKLCVGIATVAELRDWQAQFEAPRHRTRSMPRRAAEVVDGGSLYWVIAGVMLVRQRVLALEPSVWDDGSKCAAIMLDRALVPVEARAVRAFQGWRYLEPADAPADLSDDTTAGHGLPDTLRADLRRLALL